jgi:hypothetical protein
VGRKIAKAHRAKQTPHGKQTVKKLMAHGTSTNSLELSGDTKLFDRIDIDANHPCYFLPGQLQFRTHPHRLPTHFVLGFAGQFPGINLFHAQYSTTNRYLIAGLIRCESYNNGRHILTKIFNIK